MVNCAEYRPYHQGQLHPEFGGEDGGVNCTAVAAAMVAEASMCGPKWAIRGGEVREASNRATPNVDSPGLNLDQVRRALLALTGGRVALTIKQGIKTEDLKARLDRGEVALLQVQRQAFIDQGFGFDRGFAGEHAVAVGIDHDDELWVDDPLTHKFFPRFRDIADAAAALRLSSGATVGSGKAFAAFAPRAPKLAKTHRARIRPGEIWSYAMRNGLIWNRQKVTIDAAINVPCTDDMAFPTHPFGPRKDEDAQDLVILMGGTMKGRGIRPNAFTLTLTPIASPVSDREPVPFPLRIDLTSPDLPEVPDPAEPADQEDPALLDREDARGPHIGVANGIVDEPMAAPGTMEPEDDTKLGGN
jgi:hypothetical protein